MNDDLQRDAPTPPSAPEAGLEPWPLEPTDPDARGEVSALVKLFASGVVGGAITLFGVGFLGATSCTAGATRTLQLDRERQRRCLELGITPEELAALEGAQAAARAATFGAAGEDGAGGTSSASDGEPSPWPEAQR